MFLYYHTHSCTHMRAHTHTLTHTHTHTHTQYIVKEDFHSLATSAGESSLALVKGDFVEVLDSSIEGKWFVRTRPTLLSTTTNHGWVPSSILERVDSESTDGKKGWVQITAGPLSGGSDDDKLKALKQNQSSFGNHDLQSQQVSVQLYKVAVFCSTRICQHCTAKNTVDLHYYICLWP